MTKTTDKPRMVPRWSYKKIFALWLCGLAGIVAFSFVAQFVSEMTPRFTSSAPLIDTRSIHVTASQYGSAWPYFRFNEATIRCQRHDPTGRPMVTIQYKQDGPEYGLNGPALGIGGYPDPRPFIATNEDATYKAPVPPDWISRGLKLCE